MNSVRASVVLLSLFCSVAGALAADESAPPRHRDEREGSAAIIHRSDVIRDRDAASPGPMRLWPLQATPDSRMNYVEVSGRSALHFHPDADHKLYVLEGRVLVLAGTNATVARVGDLIVIPKGVRHAYDVPEKGQRALLLTFDAPPYDPKKTVTLEKQTERKQTP